MKKTVPFAALCVVALAWCASDSPNGSARVSPPPPKNPSETKYADGTYRAEGPFHSPIGNDGIVVDVTLANGDGTIAGLAVKPVADSLSMNAEWIARFSTDIKKVVGKKIPKSKASAAWAARPLRTKVSWSPSKASGTKHPQTNSMRTFRRSVKALGTELSVTLNVPPERLPEAERAVSEFFRDVAAFETRFSRFLPDSEVWNANENAGTVRKVSKGFAELWNLSETMRARTDGYFDARTESLLSRWWYRSDPAFSIGRDAAFDGAPNAEEATETFFCESRIDFWGIGKGVVLDMAKSRFERFENACVVAGGDVFVRGRHVSGNPFSIALEHPLDPTVAIGEIRFPDWGFVAWSSANRRSWGDWRGHIANPLSGMPAADMLAVFVHAREWWLADGWATAFFAMGFETAKSRSDRAEGVECLLVSTDGTVHKSKGFAGTLFA